MSFAFAPRQTGLEVVLNKVTYILKGGYWRRLYKLIKCSYDIVFGFFATTRFEGSDVARY